MHHLRSRAEDGKRGASEPDQFNICCNFETNVCFAPEQAGIDQRSSRHAEERFCEGAMCFPSGIEDAVAPIGGVQSAETRSVEKDRIVLGRVEPMHNRAPPQSDRAGTTASQIVRRQRCTHAPC